VAYDDDNIFARILRGDAPAFKVYEDDDTVAILDVMPQADGHTLVLPRARAENLFDLDDEAAAAVMRTVRRVAAGLSSAFDADGIRIMQFNGPTAGQTVFHFHMHVIPCHEGRQLRGHGRGMADMDLLDAHARRLRAALAGNAG
jgi:histidine triad (HIT) family protein